MSCEVLKREIPEAVFVKKIRYTDTIDAETVKISGCIDCQINSGAAYGVVVGLTN